MSFSRSVSFSNLRPLISMSSSIKPFRRAPYPLLGFFETLDTHFSAFLCSVAAPVSHYSRSSEVSHRLFDGMTERDVFSWTASISFLNRSKREEKAIETFRSMLLDDVRPNYVTILCIVSAVCAIRSEIGIHALVIKAGFGSEVSVVTALVGLYSSRHEMECVWQLFNQVPIKDLILWSTVVSVCSKNGRPVEAVGLFQKMQYSGVTPNDVTIVSVLPACSDLGALSLGKQIHGFAIKREFYSKISLQNSLVDMYAKCKKLDFGIAVFYGIRVKDIISWNTIICGCIDNEFPRKALLFFSCMRSSEVVPDETSIRSALGACSHTDLKFGLGLHCYTIKRCLSDTVSVGTALLRMYAGFDEVETAQRLFDNLHPKDLIAWSAMVAVYARAGHPISAFEVFKQMQLASVEANEITFVSLLRVCSSIGAQGHRHGKSIHALVIRVSYTTNVYITSALIDFYCKIGWLGQGKTLFDGLQSKDMVCWSSMINGYGINGQGEEAIDFFYNMLEQGMKPNDIVFVSVLSACSHCGLVEEGWKWFHCMEERYGIPPTLAHCSCMVDMLSRQGKIEEALEFITRMPVKPDKSVWFALLSGCRATHGDIRIIEIVAERLLGMVPRNSSYYVALSNMYAELGQWDDVERIRELVDEKQLRKTVGCSVI